MQVSHRTKDGKIIHMDISERWGVSAFFAQEWLIGDTSQKQIAYCYGYNNGVSVSKKIADFCQQWGGQGFKGIHGVYGVDRKRLIFIALANYKSCDGKCVRPIYAALESDYSDKEYYDARREYSFLLRAEGMSYRAIGARLGVSATRIMDNVRAYARRLGKAMKRTKVVIIHMET